MNPGPAASWSLTLTTRQNDEGNVQGTDDTVNRRLMSCEDEDKAGELKMKISFVLTKTTTV